MKQSIIENQKKKNKAIILSIICLVIVLSGAFAYFIESSIDRTAGFASGGSVQSAVTIRSINVTPSPEPTLEPTITPTEIERRGSGRALAEAFFILEPAQIKVSMKPGQITTKQFTIFNNVTSTIKISLSIDNLEDYLILNESSVQLSSEESAEVLATFNIPKGLSAGNYTGKILAVSGDVEESISVSINIELETIKIIKERVVKFAQPNIIIFIIIIVSILIAITIVLVHNNKKLMKILNNYKLQEHQSLLKYINKCRRLGYSDFQIMKALVKSGVSLNIVDMLFKQHKF